LSDDLKRELENIFRTSGSNDVLFDSFRAAIDSKIKDAETYKILLRNSALSIDEISMYAEKICREFPEISYSICFCVGQIFSSISAYSKYHYNAMKYFLRAAASNTALHDPYVAIIKMYNLELNIPPLEEILQCIEEGLTKVDLKSKICFQMAKLYKNMGMTEKEKAYQNMGEQYQKDGK
jgi:hypothetical protein